MKEKLFCDNWFFLKTSPNTELTEAMEENFLPVCLPHDWLIYQTENLYENSIGWYRRMLDYKELEEDTLHYKAGERVYLNFDGVYMDSTLYINKVAVMEWKYGYSAFSADITDYLKEGNNEILVKVVHMAPNSRWYSGAGIYRDVFIRVLPKTAFVPDGNYISTKLCGEDFLLEVETALQGEKLSNTKVLYELYQGDDCIESFSEQETSLKTRLPGEHGQELATGKVMVKKPALWSPRTPNLYRLKSILLSLNGERLDEDITVVGFRSMEFCPDQGFFLNGEYLKIHGVCEHHDFGCLGAAFNKAALIRKFKILKDMGVNAIRTAHNMPAKEFMNTADEMGMLVVSEAFDMWERNKTTYDYARFFKEWAKKDVESWVRRDRNHPSLMLWCIGNEIYDTHADAYGQEITKRLVSYVREHDSKENALITLGSNYMPWENAQKCADIVKIAGYNYSEKYYEEHHKQHPDWIIYGSETASVVQSRGVYHFPYKQSVLADEDEQCSALGNSTTSWGARSVEKCIGDDRDATFTMGQFLWTGFDYIGEPTPYHTKNSYFGQVDTAGFPKDAYYIYQAEWTDVKEAPMVHLFPYWDFNEGQLIDVRACSNAAAIELFAYDGSNGRKVSHGRKVLNHEKGTDFTAHWQVPYAPGTIEALAYDKEGNILARKERHSFSDGRTITAKPDKLILQADGRDLCFIEIGVEDENGYPVENAMNYVLVNVDGAAVLAGLDNGDSTDYDSYKGKVRKLFNGKLLAVIQAGKTAGKAEVQITGKGLRPAIITLNVEETTPERGIGIQAPIESAEEDSADTLYGIQPVRMIKLKSLMGCHLTADKSESNVEAEVYPEDATNQEVIFKAVNDAGIEISYAAVTPVPGEKRKALVKALGDGEFRIRCMSIGSHVKIISQLEFSAVGLGVAYLNPYEFVSGGLYTKAIGSITNGNEKGFATARGEESGVIFTDIDFGEIGSDEITLPIFSLSDAPYYFSIWEGGPGEKENGLLAETVYQKDSIWNVYQEEIYKLNRRIKGITSLSFVFHDKVHLKGFIFKKYEKAFEQLTAASCNQIYGDSFLIEKEAVTGIGNNVTLEFDDMDFGNRDIRGIRICSKSQLPANTIHIRFMKEDESEINHIVEVPGTSEYTEQIFSLQPVSGKCKVRFVFLPGSSFDYAYFRFFD